MPGKTYNVQATSVPDGVVLAVSFGEPASNDQIVKDAKAALEALNLKGGKTVFITGPASLPVAAVITHAVAHLFTETAIFDPKLQGFVVGVSHGGRDVGTVIFPAPAAE